MSQPIMYQSNMNEVNDSSYSMSQDIPYDYLPQPKKIEADKKIKQFEGYLKNISNKINDSNDNSFLADKVTIKKKDGTVVKIYYFIGRLNPPHNGHIKALKKLVKKANQTNSIPLILLGSGPNQGARTMDNPITFDTKRAFITSKLFRELPGSNFTIQKMTNPAKNVSEYVTNSLSGISNVNKILITHIAGGKDEDATKLTFALNSAKKSAIEAVPNANVTAGVHTIEADTTDTGSAMSATKVRKDAYKTIIPNESGVVVGFTGWPQEYKKFYGAFAKKIYNEIIDPTLTLPEDEKRIMIQRYIDTGELPSVFSNKVASKKRTSKVAGGVKNKSTHKNKKILTNKNKSNQTLKRSNKITRRKY